MAGWERGLAAQAHHGIVLLDEPHVADVDGRARARPASPLANRREHEPNRGDDQDRGEQLHEVNPRARMQPA